MSQIERDHGSERRRRSDAERNVAAILGAAIGMLAERPDASMAEIAAAAGVARQTVYAHYDSREALLRAVADRALAESVAAIDSAEPGRGPPAEALGRLVTTWWETIGRHARVLAALATAFPDQEALRHFHSPIVERIERLVRRGQRAGDFDRRLPVSWASAAFLGLMHSTADEVAAGRIDGAEAIVALERAIPRLFGVA
jgi:AcrR family transcriptional regulator